MPLTVKLRKSGNSVAISLPKSLREELNWQESDVVLLTPRQGALVVQRFRVPVPVTLVTSKPEPGLGK